MRVLVDAQLPPRLSRWFNETGHDSVHTSELPAGNRSSDDRIIETADRDGRIVVTKDRDFRDGHLLRRAPRRLLPVSTGNITNYDLMAPITRHIAAIVEAFKDADFVEIAPGQLVVHG